MQTKEYFSRCNYSDYVFESHHYHDKELKQSFEFNYLGSILIGYNIQNWVSHLIMFHGERLFQAGSEMISFRGVN